MNSGFFATADGVRVIEFNARFGDPECMNIMSLLAGSWPAAMERICAGALTRGDVPLREEASLVLYLLASWTYEVVTVGVVASVAGRSPRRLCTTRSL